jgi:hypothetical protein
VNVSASDNVGVSKVNLLVNGVQLASDITSPYGFSWDSTKVPNGNVTLTAYAYDAAGNATSSSISVKVANTVDTTAPTVSLTAPANGATVKGLVAVNVSASDNVGVSKVNLLVNGVQLASDTTSPYGFSWDSTKVPNGNVTLTAYAYDAAGNAASSSISVKVANTTDTTAPSATISNPGSGAIVSGTVGIQASASDNVGVKTLSLYIDGTFQTSVSGASLSYSWDTLSILAGTHTLLVKAQDAAGNVGSQSIQVTK